jgi:hypothetical protein
MTARRILWLAGLAILVMVVNVLISILYMVVYSFVIDPGQTQAYYEAHIQQAAPYSSIIAGIPLMLLAGWWAAGLWNRALGMKAAFIVWLVYAVIDLLAILSAGMDSRIAVLFAISFVTKLAAAFIGARIRLGKGQVKAAAAS